MKFPCKPLFKLAILLFATSLSAQNRNDSLKQSISTTYGEYSPRLFLGTISENPTTPNLTLDLTKEEIKLGGALLGTEDSRWLLGTNVSVSNEDNAGSIFSGSNLSPKFSGSLMLTGTMFNWISTNDTTKSYAELKAGEAGAGAKRHNYISATLGLNADGAKYYLIDTTRGPDKMVYKKKYSGWQTSLQFNWLVHNYEYNRTWSHALRFSYGEVNNVEDLTEYSITQVYTNPTGSPKNTIERKLTGYFDEYVLQHQAKISYEVGIYSRKERPHVGPLFGLDFIYNEKEKNDYRVNAGLIFPIKGKEKDLVYVAFILRTSDPFNLNKADDFKFSESLAGFIRVGVPLNIAFISQKQEKK